MRDIACAAVIGSKMLRRVKESMVAVGGSEGLKILVASFLKFQLLLKLGYTI